VFTFCHHKAVFGQLEWSDISHICLSKNIISICSVVSWL